MIELEPTCLRSNQAAILLVTLGQDCPTGSLRMGRADAPVGADVELPQGAR